ncbi:helix-turn-helix domain-containing protein [Rhodococcus rhodnii]|uniref:helix-turn-helix domain-containing protein n=1 Tax=Rhodococcus rhodnii TaxID=38312 RepID=UPI000B11B936|nr:helix-turn-helix domain-containing protein [Rhodococcus rhodnii]
MATEDDIHRFGRLVAERRRALALSLVALRNAGGPVPATTSKIERGLEPKPALATFQRLDRALNWVPGSASQAWNGGTPLPAEEARNQGALGARPLNENDGSSILVSSQLLPVLTRVVNRLREGLASAEGQMPTELISAIGDLEIVVDRLNRAWLIDYTERRLMDDGTIDDDPLLSLILAPELSARSDTALDSYDQGEAIYLRWLLGRNDRLTDDDRKRAEARFALRREGR